MHIRSMRCAVAALLMGCGALVQAQLPGSKTVQIESRDARGSPLSLTGHVFEPSGPAHSAVVLLHSSAGLTEAVQGHYGKELSAAGHLVLAVDSFKPRGILRTTDDQSQVGSIHMALDGLYARQFLVRTYPGLRRLVLMGFSKGGLATLFAADGRLHPGVTDRYDAYIAVYPSCAFIARNPKPIGPVLMLLGEKDAYSGVEPCQKWAATFEKAGGPTKVLVYPDAYHLFDGDPRASSPVYLARGESFANCLVHIEDDGQWSYRGKLYPDQLSTYTDLSRSCVVRGVSFATNLKAKAAALADIKAFLTSVAGR